MYTGTAAEKTALKSECDPASGEATFFIQYTCEQQADVIEEKYSQMSVAVVTGTLICLLFNVLIKFLFQGGKIKQLTWDMSTITAGDYTVEFEITKERYLQWRNETYEAPGGPKENGVAPAHALKTHIKEQIEAQLDSWVEHNPWVLGDD